ncbi:hypothetical protein GHT06_019790 [Daphnia sinensis]|uniref:Uncharacterized protein n=1 Tax=Daphnia sinensis TaxID=1820382 RepID=A0AAD5KKL6_9CRUS|nr:hypothetical protein GHT06_019790 [Daphnia sinensis]
MKRTNSFARNSIDGRFDGQCDRAAHNIVIGQASGPALIYGIHLKAAVGWRDYTTSADGQISIAFEMQSFTHHRSTTTCDNKMRIHARYTTSMTNPKRAGIETKALRSSSQLKWGKKIVLRAGVVAKK